MGKKANKSPKKNQKRLGPQAIFNKEEKVEVPEQIIEKSLKRPHGNYEPRKILLFYLFCFLDFFVVKKPNNR